MKRALALIMAAMIVSLSVMNTYKITAEAAGAGIVANGLYHTFSTLLGHYLGFGKSIESVNSNFSTDNMNTIVGNEMSGNGNNWNGYNVNFSDKASFMNILNSGLAKIAAYNAGESNMYFDQLNKRSYSATGTLATKTLEDRMRYCLNMITVMSATEFDYLMENGLTALNPSNEDISSIDVNEAYAMYEAMASSMLAMNSSVDTSFVETVPGSSFNLNNLYKGTFPFNGKNIPFYNLRYLYAVNYDDPLDHVEYNFSTNVYLLPLEYTGSLYTTALALEPFSMHILDYINGELSSDSIQEATLVNGFYTIQQQMNNYYNLVNWWMSKQECIDCYNAFRDWLAENVVGYNYYLNNGAGVQSKHDTLAEDYSNFTLEAGLNDFLTLSNALVNLVAPGLGQANILDQVAAAINGIATTFPETDVDGKNDVVQAVEGVGEAILTLPKAIWLEFEGTLEAIKTKALTTTRPWEDGENKENSNDILPIFNGLIILIMIVVILLKIFVHCLQFIINIFAIPASSALLPEEMRLGLEYINTIEIPVIGMSVYSFMMGLVYILIVFYAIRILRINVDRIKIPKQRTGGM